MHLIISSIVEEAYYEFPKITFLKDFFSQKDEFHSIDYIQLSFVAANF